uniref:Uncharacterized protein n=1 Tax=Rhabditophanes sp. KR3021 TaxID=114890 RepID=A0AC35U2H5_9BILA
MGKFQNQNTLPPQIRPETGQFLPTPMPPQDHGDLLPPDMKQGPVSGGIRPKQNMMRPNLQPLNTFQQTSQPVVNRDVEKSQSNLSKGKTSAKEPLRLQNINGGSGIVATKKEFETALGDKNKENPPYAGDNTKFEHAEDDPNDIHDDEEVGTQADEDVHNYAYPPKQYPLLRCFHNPSVKFHKMHIYMYICEYKCICVD